MKDKILVTLSNFGKFCSKSIDKLKKVSNNIVYLSKKEKMDKALLKKHLSNTKYYLAGTELINEDLLKGSNNLKLIARGGIGYDSVDLKYTKKRKIIVTNTPGIASQSVSELSLAFLMIYLRDIKDYDTALKKKKWHPKINHTASELKIGIIGVGNIGSKFLKFIKPLGFKKIYLNDIKKNIKYSRNKIISYRSKEYIFKNCNIISLHVPLTIKTMKLVNSKILKKMLPNSAIINTSRGEVLDEKCIENLFKSGNKKNIKFFLDVFWDEPYSGKLLMEKNVYLTPHIGSMTRSSRIQMDRIASDEIYNYHFKKIVRNRVN